MYFHKIPWFSIIHKISSSGSMDFHHDEPNNLHVKVIALLTFFHELQERKQDHHSLNGNTNIAIHAKAHSEIIVFIIV